MHTISNVAIDSTTQFCTYVRRFVCGFNFVLGKDGKKNLEKNF